MAHTCMWTDRAALACLCLQQRPHVYSPCKITPPCMMSAHNDASLLAHRSRRFRMPISHVTPAAAAATPTPQCTACLPRHCTALHSSRQLERSSGTRPSAPREGCQVQQGRKWLQRRATLMLYDNVSRARYGNKKHVMICDAQACTECSEISCAIASRLEGGRGAASKLCFIYISYTVD